MDSKMKWRFMQNGTLIFDWKRMFCVCLFNNFHGDIFLLLLALFCIDRPNRIYVVVDDVRPFSWSCKNNELIVYSISKRSIQYFFFLLASFFSKRPTHRAPYSE